MVLDITFTQRSALEPPLALPFPLENLKHSKSEQLFQVEMSFAENTCLNSSVSLGVAESGSLKLIESYDFMKLGVNKTQLRKAPPSGTTGDDSRKCLNSGHNL